MLIQIYILHQTVARKKTENSYYLTIFHCGYLQRGALAIREEPDEMLQGRIKDFLKGVQMCKVGVLSLFT